MENNPIRTKDEGHLIPEWQKAPEYLAYLEAKKVYNDLLECNCATEAKLEEAENDLRIKHLALIHLKVNEFTKIDFTPRATNKGFFIS